MATSTIGGATSGATATTAATATTGSSETPTGATPAAAASLSAAGAALAPAASHKDLTHAPEAGDALSLADRRVKEAAALRLQVMFRGHFARKYVKRYRLERKRELNIRKKELERRARESHAVIEWMEVSVVCVCVGSVCGFCV
jgi:hypothetical protein